MAKDLSVSFLLDFYGDMLTEKQRQVIDYYYNEDLSLSEIAENTGITRQGVRDSIKRGEMTLFSMEDTLGLAKRFQQVQKASQEIEELAARILEYNPHIPTIAEDAARIQELAGQLAE